VHADGWRWTSPDVLTIVLTTYAVALEAGALALFYACYTDRNGRRLKKSTGQTGRKAAMKVAAALEKAEEKARRNQFTTGQAAKLLNEILQDIGQDKVESHTCRAWLTEWLQSREGTTAASTLAKYRQVTKAFLDHLGGRGDLDIAAVTVRDVREFRDKLRAAGRMPQTVNQLLRKNLAIAFNKAKRLGLIPVNPVDAVEPLVEGESKRDIFNPEQVAAILAAANEDWRGATLIGYFTGARLLDVCNLKWSNVDLAAGTVAFKTRKTGRRILMPIHPELQEWLLSRPSSDSCAYVLPSLANKSEGGRSGLSQQFRRVMDAAGVSGRVIREASGAGRTSVSLSFHSLRHSFNSALANAGVAQDIRQALTGYASAEINERYTHRDVAPLRDAISRIGRIRPAEGER
jgi:integrase